MKYRFLVALEIDAEDVSEEGHDIPRPLSESDARKIVEGIDGTILDDDTEISYKVVAVQDVQARELIEGGE
jgi:hypothetical protein